MISTYSGWVPLSGQSWQAAVTAPSEDETRRLLRPHVEQLGAKFEDTYVGLAVDDPNDKPSPHRRRLL